MAPKEESPVPEVPWSSIPAYPCTVEEAIERLMAVLTDEEKAEIRAMGEEELNKLHHGLGTWIRRDFDLLWDGNKALMRATRERDAHGASHVIIKALWERLQRSGP